MVTGTKIPPEIREKISQGVPRQKEWLTMSFSPLTYKLALKFGRPLYREYPQADHPLPHRVLRTIKFMQLEETDYFAWNQKMENYYGNANSEPRQSQAPLSTTESICSCQHLT